MVKEESVNKRKALAEDEDSQNGGQNGVNKKRRRHVSWEDEKKGVALPRKSTQPKAPNLLESTKFSTPQASISSRIRGKNRISGANSPIEGPTLDNTHAFKMPKENLMEAKALQAVDANCIFGQACIEMNYLFFSTAI
jgi:hypothetical protein